MADRDFGDAVRSELDDDASERAIEDAVGEWIDRLIAGEELDPLAVLTAHPGIGHEVVDRLENFVRLGRPEPMQLRRLGDFRLVRELGRGGMGVVYEAHQESMDRRVALKILPTGVAADRTAFLRFMREAQTAGRLRHEAIVGVHSLGVESDTPYYAMEFIAGKSLAEIIAGTRSKDSSVAGGVFSPLEKDQSYYVRVAKAFAEVADGLHHAHREGVVHRDLKPSNVMVEANGRLRILDFGLAYFDDLNTLTLTGEVVGTPVYMSPEQARRETIPVDHRTDVYSLGATLYEVLTLSPPFRGSDRFDTLRQVMELDPPPLRTHDPLVPDALETIVLKCMRKRPESRYNTAQALAQDLARFAKGEPIEARPEGTWPPLVRKLRRNRARVLAVGGIVIAATLVGWLANQRSKAEIARERAVYPGLLRDAVGELDSGAWILQKGALPLRASGIGFQVFEPADFRDVVALGGENTVHRAVEKLHELTERCPDEPEAYYHLARAYRVLGDPTRALSELNRALDVDPNFKASEYLRAKLVEDDDGDTAKTSSGTPDERHWTELRKRADILRWKGDPRGAEALFTELIHRYTDRDPPYTGFLTECYLKRASARLALEEYDLAEEDCVRARAHHPASLVSDLFLGRIYLLAGKPDLARRTFERLASRDGTPELLPFWVVSVYLDVTKSDASEGIRWAKRVPDPALRERLATYLFLRLSRWDDAVAAGTRAMVADPEALVPRQLLAAATIKRALYSDRNDPDDWLDLARAVRDALAREPAHHRSRFLLRAGWEAVEARLLEGAEDSGAASEARTILTEAATAAGLELPSAGDRGAVQYDFAEHGEGNDTSPLRWRIVEQCCPGDVVETPSGLSVATRDPERGQHAWLVSDEVFSGDVTLELSANLGDKSVYGNVHVDLGTTTLYYGGVEQDGSCHIGKWEHGRRALHRTRVVAGIGNDVSVELRSVGDRIELRAWRRTEARPTEPTVSIEDGGHRLGAVAVSTASRPAVFHSVSVRRGRDQERR